VCLSPVRPTPSHTRVEPLGWAGLANLCAVSPLPVLALGGMRPSDLDRARSHGAFGVAGISGFGS
jgi:8-oxo-dGTP diphosphatase